MSSPTPITQRLQAHTARIQRMLTPGSKQPQGRASRLSAILPGFGGLKYKRSLSTINFLNKSRLGNLRPDLIAPLGKLVPAQFKNARSLLRLKSLQSSGAGLWSAMERIHPSQATASEPKPESGFLRQGSVIPKFQAPPALIDQASSPKPETKRQHNAPKTPEKAHRPVPNPRRFSRVEEVTGQKKEQPETPKRTNDSTQPPLTASTTNIEEPQKQHPSTPKPENKPDKAQELAKQKSTPARAPASVGQPTVQPQPEVDPVSSTFTSPTIQRQPETRSVPSTFTPSTIQPQPEASPVQSPPTPPTVQPPSPPAAIHPSIPNQTTPDQTESQIAAQPHDLPLVHKTKTPPADKSLLTATPVSKKPAPAVINKAKPSRTSSNLVEPTLPGPATRSQTETQSAMPLIQRSVEQQPAHKAEPNTMPKPEGIPATSNTPQQNHNTLRKLPSPPLTITKNPETSRQKLETPPLISPDVSAQPSQQVEQAREQKSASPTTHKESEPLQQRLEYRRLAPAQVQFIDKQPVKPAPRQTLSLKTQKPKASLSQQPIERTFRNTQALSDQQATQASKTESSSQTDRPFTIPPSVSAASNNTAEALSEAMQNLISQAGTQSIAGSPTTGTVQRSSASSVSPSRDVMQKAEDDNTIETAPAPDLDQLAESLLPRIKRILETETERSRGWLRSSHL